MPTNDKTSHIITEQVRAEVRRQLKRPSSAPAIAGIFGGGGGFGFGGDPNSGGGGGGGDVIDPEGWEYSVFPPERFLFSSASARLANLDTYVGVPFVTVMRGLASEGGHEHTGANGDGPPLPPHSVLCPGDEVAGHVTLDQHLRDPAIHGQQRAVAWDDFEVGDQAGRWQVRQGTVSRVADIHGNTRWQLEPGTVVRLRSPGFTWNDRVTVRFDLELQSVANPRVLEVKLRVRPGSLPGGSGYSYVAGFSSSSTSYIGQVNHATGEFQLGASGFTLSNDGLRHTVEVVLDGDQLRMLGEGNQLGATLLHQDQLDEGYLELQAPSPGARVWIDNFLVLRNGSANIAEHHTQHHAAGADPLDVKDLADSLSLLVGGAPGAHAPTHSAVGTDPVDVKNLLDSEGRLLLGSQRAILVGGGIADSLHVHSQTGAQVEPAALPLPLNRQRSLGISTYAARSDHVHAPPHWYMQYYVSTAVPSNYAVDDVDFDSSPVATVRRQLLPTVGGEFFWSPRAFGLLFRAWLQVANSSASNVVAQLIVPSLVGNLRVKYENPVDGLVQLLYRDTDSLTLNTLLTLNLRPGVTTKITLYGSYDSTDAMLFWVAPAVPDGDLFSSSLGLAWSAPFGP